MAKCTLVVKDCVNVKFEGLDPVMRHKLHNAVKFMIPSARHMPKFKLGRWDGKISFCSVAGATYLNLLDRLLPILEEDNIEIEIDDRRLDYDFIFPEVDADFLSEHIWPENHKKAGQPIILEDHQVHIVNSLLNNTQSVVEAGTGAGKTICTALLSSLVEPYGRSIVIVPNISLVRQTEKDYKNIGLDVGVYFGERKEWNKTHTICTWQSLSVYNKNTKSGEAEVPLEAFIEGVICVMLDEAHMAKGAEIRGLLGDPFANVPIRWGLTGSIPKDEHESICLLASIGPKVAEVQTYDLQESGFLAKCDVDIVQTEDQVAFSNYPEEHKFLLSNESRLKFMAEFLQITAKETGNTLVLVDRIETGHALKKLIPDSAFVFGKTKQKARETEYESFQVGNEKITIATYGVASVGISIDRIFNLVFIEPGKSFVRTVQSIGRGLRTAQDKNYVRIIDLCSNLKYSKRHLAKRKTFYSEKKWVHNTKKVTYRLDE